MNRAKSGIASGRIDDIKSCALRTFQPAFTRSLGEAAKLGELTELLWFE